MTRLITDGAESGDLLLFSAQTGTPTNVTTSPRSGNRCYQCATSQSLTINIPGSALGELYFRVGFFTTLAAGSSVQCVQFKSAGTQVFYISYNGTTQKFNVGMGASTDLCTTTATFPNNTWYLLELHYLISDSVGVAELKVEGVSAATFSGDTKPSTQTTVDQITFFVNNSGVSNRYDDIALNDTGNANGLNDNAWCGDGKIVALTPNAAGDVTGLTASAGSNYQCVDEVPSNGDTDFVSASSTLYDLYNMTTYTLATGESVQRLWVEARARETSATGDKINLGVKTNSNEYNAAADIVVTTSYARYVSDDYKTNPQSGSPWTQSELDAVQEKVKVV